jgi:hypothetical protein
MLALYIQPNPRDLILASKNTLKLLVDLFTNTNNQEALDAFNPATRVRNEIGKAQGRKLFVDFDFDNVDMQETREKIKEYINLDATTFFKSKNGFHVVVQIQKWVSCCCSYPKCRSSLHKNMVHEYL